LQRCGVLGNEDDTREERVAVALENELQGAGDVHRARERWALPVFRSEQRLKARNRTTTDTIRSWLVRIGDLALGERGNESGGGREEQELGFEHWLLKREGPLHGSRPIARRVYVAPADAAPYRR
jgi:hypothetical protein